MIIVNKSARFLVIGDIKLIPMKPVKVTATKAELVKQFPRIAELLKSGELETVTERGAKSIEAEADELALEHIRENADKKGIKIPASATKDEALAIVEAARTSGGKGE